MPVQRYLIAQQERGEQVSKFSSTSKGISLGLCVLVFALAIFILHTKYFIHTDKILHFLSESCYSSIISFDTICLNCQ